MQHPNNCKYYETETNQILPAKRKDYRNNRVGYPCHDSRQGAGINSRNALIIKSQYERGS